MDNCKDCGYDFPMRDDLTIPNRYCTCNEDCTEDEHKCYVEESEVVDGQFQKKTNRGRRNGSIEL